MSSRFEQNRREERRRVWEKGRMEEDGGGVCTEDALMRAFLPWMDVVVSLRVRDWVKGGGGGGGKKKPKKNPERKD